MATINPLYLRLTNASAGTSETALLSGTQGTDYIGSPTLGANTILNPQTFVVRAWGQYNASGINQNLRIRLYFNFGGGASQILLADTGTRDASSDGANYEWYLEAMVTIRTTGASGTLWGDGFFFSQLGYQAGVGAYTTNINTTNANTFELTGQVSSNVILTLRQALIEQWIP